MAGSRAVDRGSKAGTDPAAARRTAASLGRKRTAGGPGRGIGASQNRLAQDSQEFLRAALQHPHAQHPQGAAALTRAAARSRAALASGPGEVVKAWLTD